jgi:hypothetical protein
MRNFYVPILLLLCATTAFSQGGAGDTTFISAAVKNTIQRYQQAIGVQAKLNNGSKYLPPEQDVDEHPYFLSEDWIMGDVHYDDELFTGVPLMYDLYTGQLVTEHSASGHAIQLIFEKVRRFTIQDHVFEKIDNETVNNSLPETGFYDILYAGDTKVVSRRQKLQSEEIYSTYIEVSYDEKYRYFLFKNGIFFPVKNRASVLKLLSDEKQSLKRYLKTNKIKFSENREFALKSMAAFYDSQKQGKI